MNAKVEQILRKQAYNFAIQIGKTEAEAQAEADESILRINKMVEKQKNEVWVDITTGEKHIPRNPY
jgi:hypothetical protein